MAFPRLIVTGTDTGIGKTVFAAALAGALGAYYWKPVQAGIDEDEDGFGRTDADRTRALGGLSPQQVLPEAYRLTTPCSPHRAAEIDEVEIEERWLTLPEVPGPLVIEGAGGVLVPLTRHRTYADQFAAWNCPVVLVARTALGTINHTLLSLEALRSRGVPVLGVAFVGGAEPDSERTVAEMGKVQVLGRLPLLDPLTPASLHAAFAANFALEPFLG